MRQGQELLTFISYRIYNEEKLFEEVHYGEDLLLFRA